MMDHLSKLGDAIVNTITAAQSGDGAELAKSIIHIVTNAGGIIGDIIHALGL
ncbi:phenol soluble modulin beta 1 [Staphylococcus saccharolyticus]|mgnify:FL=1|uniref:Phenol soluble modulin beta 1 n=2 Tax=Staphylococcus saccharolyticus TaxID=33028 RepID=A0A380GY76_9STAP|nr:phenol soluble modulin beta 1 [Staphylococcus saccharolyticus]